MAWTRRARSSTTALAGLGFASYDHFMQAVLAAELSERAARRRARVGHEPRQRPRRRRSGWTTCWKPARRSTTRLGALFANVEDFLGGVKTLDGKATFLLDLSLNVHLVALNALISSCRVGGEGSQGLAAVAQNLATQSHDSMRRSTRMTKPAGRADVALRDIALNLSTATLQVEMTAFFLAGAAAGGRGVGTRGARPQPHRHARAGDWRQRGAARRRRCRRRRRPFRCSRGCRIASRPTCSACRACTCWGRSRPGPSSPAGRSWNSSSGSASQLTRGHPEPARAA